MPRKVDTTRFTSFEQITERLDQIVGQVRKKDLPLESSLDLFDEAIALGSKAVDFVDTTPITPEEIMRARDAKGVKDETAQDGKSQEREASPDDAGTTEPAAS